MALGKPAIPIVRAVDARGVEGALAAVRERLAAIERQLTTTTAQAGQSTLVLSQSNSSVANLQAQISVLQSTVDELERASAGPTADYRADGAVSQYDVVYPTSDGGVSAVDTQDVTAMFAAVGIAEAAASAGSDVSVRRSGAMTLVGASFDVGRAVYAQVGGGLTQHPNYADVVIPVGVALTSTTLSVSVGWAALRAQPLYAGGFEDYLPVVYGLVRGVLDLVNTLTGQPDGFVVKVGDQFVTRSITASSGSGVEVTDGDGVFGDPDIRLG